MSDEFGSDDSLELSTPEQGSATDDAASVCCMPVSVPVSVGRLHLRAPKPSDATCLVKLANDYEVASQTSNMPHPYGETEALDWIASSRQKHADRRSFVIQLLPDEGNSNSLSSSEGKIIGACRFGKPHEGYAGFEIGYWLGQPFWGQGYAADACHALIDHIFNTTNAQSIWVSCRVTNLRSRRVIEKCGFQFRESGMSHSVALGGMSPVERFVLDRQIWESLKAWGKADV